MSEAQTVPAVYRAIAAVSADLAKIGIRKTRKNEQQHYNFRGIDEVLNTLAPVLAAHGLVILPRVTSRDVTERTTKTGSVLFFVTVRVEFDFMAIADGSCHTIVTYGEAQDSGDKATNKAMSAAYKYAAFLAFCIPVEAMATDADATTAADVVPAVPKGFDAWLDDLTAVSDEGEAKLKAAWLSSSKELRAHLTSTHPELWASLKAKAVKVEVSA